MRALVIESIGKLALAEVPDPVAGPGEAVVTLKAAALNHRDVWIKKGQYAGSAPVPLLEYNRSISEQSLHFTVTAESLRRALWDLVLPDRVINELGAARRN